MDNLKEYQRTELHCAIAQYLGVVGCGDLAAAVRERLHVGENNEIDGATLPTRWGSLQSLQLRVQELEERLSGCHCAESQNDSGNVDKYPLLESALILRGFSGSISCSAAVESLGHMITGGSEGDVRVWSADSGAQLTFLKNSHLQAVTCVCASADGTWVCSGGEDATVRVWRPSQRYQPVHVLSGHQHPVLSVHLLSEDRLISVDNHGGVALWNLVEGELKSFVETKIAVVSCSAVVSSSDGDWLFLGDSAGAVQPFLLEGDKLNPTEGYKLHSKIVSTLSALVLDGAITVISGSRDGDLCCALVDPDGHLQLKWRKPMNAWINGTSVHPNKHSLYVCVDNQRVSIIDLQNSGLELLSLPMNTYPQSVSHCASTDTALIVAAQGRESVLLLLRCVDKTEE